MSKSHTSIPKEFRQLMGKLKTTAKRTATNCKSQRILARDLLAWCEKYPDAVVLFTDDELGQWHNKVVSILAADDSPSGPCPTQRKNPKTAKYIVLWGPEFKPPRPKAVR